ncbi:hypothetical protein FOA52_013083 [Chlamydomonas sp. UWO 241]|nr:hypothetical protein FOA52_013083 [Chlamydomonas sp. UWO 241]
MALEGAAKSVLKDASRVVVFSEDGTVLYSDFQADPSELKTLAVVFVERDAAIRTGMMVGGTRYEVHRFHPPAVYGRTMGGTPETSEGAAVYKVDVGTSGGPAYCFITYQMPNISARMVPLLTTFCNEHLAAKS